MATINSIVIIEVNGDNNLKETISLLKSNGFYQRWESGDSTFTLPKNCVWKPTQIDEEQNLNTSKMVFGSIVNIITTLVVERNKQAAPENAINIESLLVVPSLPWASLADKKPEVVEEWPTPQIKSAWESFYKNYQSLTPDGNIETAKALFKSVYPADKP
jgi:hypothetical protein